MQIVEPDLEYKNPDLCTMKSTKYPTEIMTEKAEKYLKL